MKHHIAAATVSLAAGFMLLGPGTALAQTATPPSPSPLSSSTFTAIPVTGTGSHHKKFTGTYTVNRFVTKAGKTYASGTLQGKLGNRHISRANVLTPVTTTPSGAKTAATTPPPASCPILHLVLAPINLNVLGLVVNIPNPIVLDITAVPGAGNLLGNLLCSVSHLLDGTTPPTPLTPAQITTLLNVLLLNAETLLTGL